MPTTAWRRETMIRHLLIIAVLSALAVFFVKQIHNVLYVLGYMQAVLATALSNILPQFTLTKLISQTFILILIPVSIGVIVPLLYGSIMYKEVWTSPRIMWIVWLFSLIIFLISL